MHKKYYFYFLFFIINVSFISLSKELLYNPITKHSCITWHLKPPCNKESTKKPYDFTFHFQSHFSNKKENLLTYSAEELKKYFEDNHYSEKDILLCNELYMSDEFVRLAKTYSGYEQAVIKLYNKFNHILLVRIFNYLFNDYYIGLLKKLHQLYNELKHCRQLTNEKAKSFAHFYNINLISLFPNDYDVFSVYKNYMDILNEASCIPLHNDIMRDCIGQAAGIGLIANKHGCIEQASHIADFCWSIIDCAIAFGEGIYLGTTRAVESIIHPVQTVKNTLIGIGIITYGLMKLTALPIECAVLYATDRDSFYIKKDIIEHQLNMICSNVFQYAIETPKREIIKQGSAFITDLILYPKLCSFTYSISQKLCPLVKDFFKYIAINDPIACLADGSLIKIEIPKNINIESIKNNILKMESLQPLSQNIPAVSYSIEEITNAIATIEPNRIHHILTPITKKHAWNKIVTGEVTWENVKCIIEKVMLKGHISLRDRGFQKTLFINDQEVVVTFINEANKTLIISNAWVKTI